MVQKSAVYVVLGIDTNGIKDVLSIEIGGNESSKFWLAVLNNLKNRGLKDILVLCADGLSGVKLYTSERSIKHKILTCEVFSHVTRFPSRDFNLIFA